MHRNEYRRMAHEEVEEIFREILPQAGMKVREEQINYSHFAIKCFPACVETRLHYAMQQ